MLVKIKPRILIFPGTDFHFPSTAVPPGTFLGSGVCWHAGPTPHSLLRNLHLCVLPAVSLPDCQPRCCSCCRFAGSCRSSAGIQLVLVIVYRTTWPGRDILRPVCRLLDTRGEVSQYQCSCFVITSKSPLSVYQLYYAVSVVKRWSVRLSVP